MTALTSSTPETTVPVLGAHTHEACRCTASHAPRRVVLTGGPGAGKTAILELLSHTLCRHVTFVPESAGMLFLGGFPRRSDVAHRRAVQRAIYHVQVELEGLATIGNPALVLCDRGVVDGFAYWPGPDEYWDAVGTTRAAALARYDAVIHLRTPNGENGYGHQNPMRSETAREAGEIDRRILAAWDGHPRRLFVEATEDFLTKAGRALDLIRAKIPPCCRGAAQETIAEPRAVRAATV